VWGRRFAHRGDFEHQLFVDVEPARSVEQDHVVAFGTPDLQGSPGDRHRPLAGTIGNVSTPVWRPSWASCSCAAGRCTSSEAINTFFRSRVFSRSAILAAVVVLPEPCSPISITATATAR